MGEPKVPGHSVRHIKPERKRILVIFQRCLSIFQVVFGIASTVLGVINLSFQERGFSTSCRLIVSSFDYMDLILVIWSGFWVFLAGIVGMYHSFLTRFSKFAIIRDLVLNSIGGILSLTRAGIGIPLFFLFNIQVQLSAICPLEIVMSACGVASILLCLPGFIISCYVLKHNKVVYKEEDRVIECISAKQMDYNNPTYEVGEPTTVTQSTRI